MKIIKNIFLGGLLLIGVTGISFGQKAEKQPSKIEKTFVTSSICNDCKGRLEETLNYTKGITYAELNVPTKKLTVRWNPKKISEDEIKKIVSNVGYSIDEVKANPEAVERLPECCQPGSGKH